MKDKTLLEILDLTNQPDIITKIIDNKMSITTKLNNMQVLRTSKENGSTETISLSDAIKDLSGFWKYEAIEPMLLDKQKLFTPYYEYQII